MTVSVFDLSSYICPICGKTDVRMYKADHLKNYYRCLSTSKDIDLAGTDPRFVKSKALWSSVKG